MEVHKPKPWHGLHEFLKEYLIIVLGVLTALSGEQIVESVHRHQELSETREALRLEIAGNARALAMSIAQDKCRSVRFDQFLRWAEGGPRPAPAPPLGVTSLTSSAWDVAKAGPLAKMPVAERLKYSALYDDFESLQGNLTRETNDGLELSQYIPLATLAPGQAQRVVEIVNRDHLMLGVKATNLANVTDKIEALGIRRLEVTDSWRQALDAYCRVAGVPIPKV